MHFKTTPQDLTGWYEQSSLNRLADNLRYLLDLRKRSAQQLADHLKLPWETIDNWINAKEYPPDNLIYEIASYLGVNKHSLINESQANNNEFLHYRMTHEETGNLEKSSAITHLYSTNMDITRIRYDRIKALRLSTGRKLSDVAEIIGITEEILRRYESMQDADKYDKDNDGIGFSTLDKLSLLYQVDPDYLIGKTDDPALIIHKAAHISDENRKVNYANLNIIEMFQVLDKTDRKKVEEYIANLLIANKYAKDN